MKKLIMLILIFLISAAGYGQSLSGKIKIGSVTLRDSSGVLVIDSRLKVNSSSWLPIKAIDQADITGNGLAVVNGKLSVVPGKGLNVINDSITYTGTDVIQVDNSQMYIDDFGVYKIKPYISFDSLKVAGRPISKNDSNQISFDDISINRSLSIYCPVNLYSNNPKINFGRFTTVYTSKLEPNDMYFVQRNGGPFRFMNNEVPLFTIAPGQITTSVPVVTNETVKFNNRVLGNTKSLSVTSNLTLSDANCFKLEVGSSEYSTIELIDATGWTDGSIVTFILINDITFLDESSSTNQYKGIRMFNRESANLAAGTVISLMYSASFDLWIEIGRNR